MTVSTSPIIVDILQDLFELFKKTRTPKTITQLLVSHQREISRLNRQSQRKHKNNQVYLNAFFTVDEVDEIIQNAISQGLVISIVKKGQETKYQPSKKMLDAFNSILVQEEEELNSDFANLDVLLLAFYK